MDFRRPMSPMPKINGGIYHHTAHPSWGVDEVHNHHRNDLEWNGFGYDYMVMFDGTVYGIRKNKIGAHAGDPWNRTYIGVAFQGNLHKGNSVRATPMTNEQIDSGAKLFAKLALEHDFSIDDWKGHRDVGSTVCPGNLFEEDRIIEKAWNYYKGANKDMTRNIKNAVIINTSDDYPSARRLIIGGLDGEGVVLERGATKELENVKVGTIFILGGGIEGTDSNPVEIPVENAEEVVDLSGDTWSETVLNVYEYMNNELR